MPNVILVSQSAQFFAKPLDYSCDKQLLRVGCDEQLLRAGCDEQLLRVGCDEQLERDVMNSY